MNELDNITEEHKNELIVIYKSILDVPDSYFLEVVKDVDILINDINSGKRKHSSLYPYWFVESLDRLGYDLK